MALPVAVAEAAARDALTGEVEAAVEPRPMQRRGVFGDGAAGGEPCGGAFEFEIVAFEAREQVGEHRVVARRPGRGGEVGRGGWGRG